MAAANQQTLHLIEPLDGAMTVSLCPPFCCAAQVWAYCNHSNGCCRSAKGPREDASVADALPGPRAALSHIQPGVGRTLSKRCSAVFHTHPLYHFKQAAIGGLFPYKASERRWKTTVSLILKWVSSTQSAELFDLQDKTHHAGRLCSAVVPANFAACQRITIVFHRLYKSSLDTPARCDGISTQHAKVRYPHTGAVICCRARWCVKAGHGGSQGSGGGPG